MTTRHLNLTINGITFGATLFAGTERKLQITAAVFAGGMRCNTATEIAEVVAENRAAIDAKLEAMNITRLEVR